MPQRFSFWLALVALLLLSIGLSLSLGATQLAFVDVLSALGVPVQAAHPQAQLILEQIRLPRMLLAVVVGSVLAISGVAMQGLFRNPLADPGLIGVAMGASLGAAIAIVGSSFLGNLPVFIAPYLLSGCAFLGGLVTVLLVYRIGTKNGQTQVGTMLLAGIAFTALTGALVGLFSYLADDAQLRTLSFWNLGSLSGASYTRLIPVIVVGLGVFIWLLTQAQSLNALLLGESEARHLGIDTQGLKRKLIFCVALATGTVVAATGLIGFIGLIVPHLMRLVVGSDHRYLLPASALVGASLLLLADVLARLAMAPAEMPIGIITALLGAPFFLYLLIKSRD
ncbi:iron chelate uptake ABC transporter family permease subunit [Pseudomonas sp. F1_0610]|uniref:FecCD family ABC transporter permease n=1 Tax=Pseudomonas sp. F1_0610 TaxID=3114284 RepID=UPI0039C1BFCC